MCPLINDASPLQPQFDPALTPQERQVVEEELAILAAVHDSLHDPRTGGYVANYDQELLELRDSLAEAHEDEIAQIVTQMDQLSSISSHQERERYSQVHRAESPYFGHLRVRQGGRELDILIGNQSALSSQTHFPIIDWREAPISRVYFCYREGDEYEEELGGRVVEGEVLAHRAILIVGGRLVRVEAGATVLQLTRNAWRRVHLDVPNLSGGEGVAFRASSLAPARLGVNEDGLQRPDRRLQAITGLIDREQFELITRPDAGIVVIDGGAGSGKTTIALHRMAYLNFRDAERFSPANMMAIVYNRALAAYISEILPAVGVHAARIEVFEAFEEALRRRHYPDMPETYNENTPLTVIRFKQHPAALAIIEQAVQRLAGELRESIVVAVRRTPSEARALEAWDSLAGEPLVPRAQRFAQWVRSSKAILPGIGVFGDDWLARQRLRKLSDEWPVAPQQAHQWPLAIWGEAFLHKEPLLAALEALAPGEFSAGQVASIHAWALAQYQRREDHRAWKQDGVAAGDEPDGPQPQAPEPPTLDREDDTLLLLLYTRMVGPLRGRRQKPLQVQHLMIDEAQDFGPLDLHLMFGLAQEPHSVTLAGDTSQRMILHNGFDSWEDVLGHLGLQGTPVSPLRIGYRSTAEIMRFARAVLGPLADERPWIPTRKGVPVELFRFTDTGQAAMTLSGALRELQRNEPHANVAIVARYPAQADLLYQGLQKTEVPHVRRVREQDFSFKPGIEVTDVAQVKGLEFDYVILIDVDAATYPDDTASRYLLHIGATRAAHQLWLLTNRAPSPLIPQDIAPRYF